MNEKYPLGEKVRVTVDRPLGSSHPNHRELIYEVKYGYIKVYFETDIIMG